MSLNEIAELSFRQVFPNPGDETRIKKEEFISTARSIYAFEMWKMQMAEKALEGWFNIPSYLMTEETLDVVNNEIDISKLKILRSLTGDVWLQNIGGLTCECEYVRSTVNHTMLLCDDDSLPERTYIVVGNKIKFPKGVHTDKLPIIYANNGSKVDENIEIDDAVAGIVRVRLVELYLGKTGVDDRTNNSNSNM